MKKEFFYWAIVLVLAILASTITSRHAKASEEPHPCVNIEHNIGATYDNYERAVATGAMRFEQFISIINVAGLTDGEKAIMISGATFINEYVEQHKVMPNRQKFINAGLQICREQFGVAPPKKGQI